MSGTHVEAKVKKGRKGGVKGNKKETNNKDQAQPKESARYACDGRHKECDERHTKSTPVTSVTHGVTNVTPVLYIFGARNSTDHVEAHFHARLTLGSLLPCTRKPLKSGYTSSL